MTPAYIVDRVAEIKAVIWDDEVAHSKEDILHEDVLNAIANGSCEFPRLCAIEALKTRELDFARWCA